jgi:glycine hydroxymethyltransferase
MGTSEMKKIGQWIAQVLNNADNADVKNNVHNEVKEMCKHFPIY